MATHGIATARQAVGVPIVERAELEWSKWFRCETSFNLMLVPQRPGIYAVAEEVRGPGATSAGKRILTVHQFAAEDDLARALGRLFTPASPFYERVLAGRCFLRYAVAEDAGQRASTLGALQSWLAASAEAAATERNGPQVPAPTPLPAGF
jgi:hypothetical protein